MHYVMDDLEVDYLLDAIDFIAQYGSLFLRLYDFDLYDGSWKKKDDPTRLRQFSLASALDADKGEETPMPFEERQKRYSIYLEEAKSLAGKLQKQTPPDEQILEGALGEVQFFNLPECCIDPNDRKSGKGVMGRLKAMFTKK